MNKPLKISLIVASLLTVVMVARALHTDSASSVESVAVVLPPQAGLADDRETKTSIESGASTDNRVLNVEQPPGAEVGLESDSENKADSELNSAEPDPEKLLQAFVTSGDPQGIRRVFAERRKERAKRVKARMDHQAVDIEWSRDLTSRFEFARKLVPELANLKLTQTDCRDTICAIHIAYEDARYDQYRPFLQQVGIVLGADAWVHHDAFPDGGVIYVARGNEELPDLKQL